MRHPDPSSLTSRIATRVRRGGGDRLWTYEDFRDLGASTGGIAAALSRLTRKRELRRIRRGIYYRPALTAFGESRPDLRAALETTLRRRRADPTPSGLEAWARLGLTSQVTSVSTVTSPKRVRMAPVLGHRVRTVVRAEASRAHGDERAVLDALRVLRRIPGTTPENVLDRVRLLLRAGKLDLPSLVKMARREPPRVRALLGALIEEAKVDRLGEIRDLLEVLRASLNPLTTFRIPEAAKHLKTAAAWNIR